MTIMSTHSVEHYCGDGMQTHWPVAFPFLRPEDVRATVSGIDGNSRELVCGTDYAVTELPGGGSGVVCAPGVVGAGEHLTLWRDQPFTQEMDLRNTGVLDAEMLERGLDRLTLMAQQLRDVVDRCVKTPVTAQGARPDALLADIAANVRRAERAALDTEQRAAGATTDAMRAEVARDAATAAASLAQATVAPVAHAPQSIVRCRMAAPMGFPYHDLALPGFLAFSGLSVTVQASPEAPFVVCFGSGGASAVGQVAGNLALTLPAGNATHWLYVDRDPDTGALTPGAADIPPEYGAVRRGVECLPRHTGYAGAFGTASASSEAYGGYYAWKAFTGNNAADADSWTSVLNKTVPPQWLRYVFSRPRRLVGVIVACGNKPLRMPRDFSIRVAATADLPDTTVMTVAAASGWGAGSHRTYRFDAPVMAKSLEIYITRNNGDAHYHAIGGVLPLFAHDWYSPQENIMRDAQDRQVQRVYVGRAVTTGGAVTAVAPFHPGVEAIVPVNNGNVLAHFTTYTQGNPFGAPLAGDPRLECSFPWSSDPTLWAEAGWVYRDRWHGFVRRRWNNDMFSFQTVGDTALTWWHPIDRAYIGSNTTTRVRARVRRGF